MKALSLKLSAKNFGRYGFVIKNIKRIRPTRAKGNLNFLDYSK